MMGITTEVTEVTEEDGDLRSSTSVRCDENETSFKHEDLASCDLSAGRGRDHHLANQNEQLFRAIFVPPW